MTAQHTPGPWTAKSLQVWSDQTGYGVAYAQRSIFPTEEEMQIAHANARLIAAAPDLLEALQAAVECGMVPISSVSEGGASKHSRQVQVADMIRAAIARATHKEQT